MLPSTGNFKETNCPLFNAGLCERPYCHFRHPRKGSSKQSSSQKADSSFISESVKENVIFHRHLTPEADKQSMEQTDLQGSLTHLSQSSNMENISGDSATNKTDSSTAFASRESLNSSTPQQAPANEPTPTSDPKNHHIPIASLSSLIQNRTVLKRRSNNIDSFSQTKWTKASQNDCKEFSTFSSLKNNCEQGNVLGINQESSLNASLETEKRWEDHEFKHTSSRESIKENSYLSFATIAHDPSPAGHKHSEETAVTMNERLAVTGFAPEICVNRISPLKFSEPEYQSFCSYKSIQNHVTNDISKREDFAKANSDIGAEIIKNQRSEYGELVLGSDGKENENKKENKSDKLGGKQKESNKRCNNKIEDDDSNIRIEVRKYVSSKDNQKEKENRSEDNNRRKRDDTIKEGGNGTDSENGNTMTNHSSSIHSDYKHSSKKSEQNNHVKNCNYHRNKSDVHSNIISHKRRGENSPPVHCCSLSEKEVTDTGFHDDTLSTGIRVSCNGDERSKQYHSILLRESETNFTEKKTQPSLYLQQAEEATFKSGRHRIAHEGAQNRKLMMPPSSHRSAPSQILSVRSQKDCESRDSGVTRARKQTPDQAGTCVHSQATLDCPSSTNQGHVMPSAPQSKSALMQPPVGKTRIAHVPNVASLLEAKRKLQEKLKQSCSESTTVPSASTNAQELPKAVRRIAHVPLNSVLARPVMRGVNDKISHTFRQQRLNILIEAYLQVCSCKEEACERATDEEKSIYNRSTSRNLYSSYISNTIMRLRKASEINKILMSEKIKQGRNIGNATEYSFLSKGEADMYASWNIKETGPSASVVSKSLYESLSRFVLTEEQLKQNGFPLSHGKDEGIAVIHHFYNKPFIPKTPFERKCDRCSKIYYVNEEGFAVEEDLCVHHWGRSFQTRRRGCMEYLYSCCKSNRDAIGCSVVNCHVSDNYDPNNLRGFVKTLPKETSLDGDYSVYALDCEMCYTTVGLELSRVTVVDTNRDIVYESLVKPESTIIDYNTRFSGIGKNDLEDVSTNIHEVQSTLLSIIHDKTIIVGHSLESDFKALKVIHGTVVDTSVVYPHKTGPPKKRALKSLCREILKKIIQENAVGHDSAEDACAAMELMLFKVKEEAKTR